MEQRCQGPSDVFFVEAMPVGAIELLDKPEQSGDVRFDRSADGMRVGANVHGFMVTVTARLVTGTRETAGVGDGPQWMAQACMAVGVNFVTP